MSRNQLREKLSKIGKHSMLVINESHRLLGKGQVWEHAVEINKIAHDLHKELDNSSCERCALTNTSSKDLWEI